MMEEYDLTLIDVPSATRRRTPSDTRLSLLAGVLLVVGCLIGGLIIASGILAHMPGADTLLALALLLLVPATLGLIAFLTALNK